MKRLLEEAKRMIRINSETSRGNEELANTSRLCSMIAASRPSCSK